MEPIQPRADFVHLHTHTTYSLLDGMNRIDALVERAQAFGMPALAITDHGTMFGVIDFYQKVSRAGLRPIVGCEIYVSRGSMRDKPARGEEQYNHLTLLAANEQGYRNLLKIVSAAHLEGFHYKPRVDKEFLAAHAKGLLALSGCLKGEIPQLVLSGREPEARKVADDYQSIFGAGRFFLELQDNGMEEQRRSNKGLAAISRETGIPVVATNDCHYLDRADAPIHEALLCIQTGKKLSDPDRMKLSTDQFYFRSPQEMAALFDWIPEAVTNTVRVAEMCNLILEFDAFLLPHYQAPEGYTLPSYIRELAEEGLARKLAPVPDARHEEYRKRLRYELEVIENMGFPGYFLIVWDFIRHARSRGISVGPGRGSAAGSLVAFALGITQLDPIVHGLIFERFLNPGRKSMPDIDVDFSMDRRDEVFAYVREKYGQDRVAQIITFGTMMAKAVIRDVGRVMDMPYAEVDRIAKMIPGDPKITLDQALEAEPRLQELAAGDPQVGKLVAYAKQLEGLSRHASTHAAGVVISQGPLTDHVPLYRGSKGEVDTQYAMDDLQKIGLVKFDLLGLRTLTVIHDALVMINEKRVAGTEPLEVAGIPLDDPEAYRLLAAGSTTGIFQMESTGMTDLTVKLKLTSFPELVALISLYRPGPMSMADDFVKRKHGKVPIKYLHPRLKPILDETYGILLYQEQVLRIAAELGGFTLPEADNLRKAMGKKDPEVMARQREKFVKGAVAGGVKEKVAGDVFDLMEKFAGYGFNKSHSAAYAVVAIQTAWLKAHHPREYMAALLTSESGDTDRVVKYINECREMGIQILPPDLNESGLSFAVRQEAIRFGLAGVKNVGEAAIEVIMEARGSVGRFLSLQHFCGHVDTRKVNKRVIEGLIKAGAFDFTGARRAQLLAGLDSAMEHSQQVQRDRLSGQASIFDSLPADTAVTEEPLPDVPEMPEHKLLAFEKESLGFYITGHPLARYAEKIRLYSSVDTLTLGNERDGSTVTVGGMVGSLNVKKTKKKEIMAVGQLEDVNGAVEVVFFPKVWAQVCGLLERLDEPFLVTGKLNLGETAPRLHVEELVPLEQAAVKVNKNVHLRLIETGMELADVGALKEILARHHGGSPVFVHLVVPEHSETVIALGESSRVTPGDNFFREIESRFGERAVSLR